MNPIKGPYVVESVFDENCAVDICLSREAEIPGQGSPQLIASCYGGEDDSGGHDTVAQAEANARLFAASWELLAACLDSVAWIERHLQTLEHRDVKDDRGNIINGFEAAIIPDWDMRQKLESLRDDIAKATS